MIAWLSLAVLIFLAAVLVVGWFRGWSMMFTLIAAMAGAFIAGVASAEPVRDSLGGSPLLDDLAWRPAYLSLDAWMHWHTAVSTMFLHADVAHILVNVIVFAFMGLGFEERVGRGRFLATFLVSGVIGTLLHSAPNLGAGDAHIPVVGASGAVFGIIGAYATMYPRDRVVLFVFIILPNVPVYIAGLVYTAVELVALGVVSSNDSVARLAHLGGIVGGALVAFLLLRTGYGGHGPDPDTKRPVDVRADVENLVRTEQQRVLYQRVVDNRDEPDIANAWLEKLARETPCPECAEALEATNGALRSGCGYKLQVLHAAKATRQRR